MLDPEVFTRLPDPEVVAKAKRRTYTAEYKQRILLEAEAAAAMRGSLGASSPPRRSVLVSADLLAARAGQGSSEFAGSSVKSFLLNSYGSRRVLFKLILQIFDRFVELGRIVESRIANFLRIRPNGKDPIEAVRKLADYTKASRITSGCVASLARGAHSSLAWLKLKTTKR